MGKLDSPAPLSLLVAAAVGVAVGVGAFTFRYGEGLSYFSTDPRACANCHIMNDQYASWMKGPHHGSARCVDCHLPHALVPKYLAKADEGYRHSKGFTFMDFHEPIQITAGSSRILQHNCEHCHEDFVHEILHGPGAGSDRTSCVHCHRGVGHGARG